MDQIEKWMLKILQEGKARPFLWGENPLEGDWSLLALSVHLGKAVVDSWRYHDLDKKGRRHILSIKVGGKWKVVAEKYF